MITDLPFATVEDLGNEIFEVIPKEGAEMDEKEAQILIDYYHNHSSAPKVLVNRTHEYYTTFEFMDTMVNNSVIQAFAIYVPGYKTALVAESQKFLFTIPFERFLDRDEAIAWLKRLQV